MWSFVPLMSASYLVTHSKGARGLMPSMDYIEELLAAGGKETFPVLVEKLSTDYRNGKMRKVEYLEELGAMLAQEWERLEAKV